MKRSNILVLTILIVILDIVLLISILAIRDATLKNNLINEVDSLIKLDFTKDRYNTPLRTSGKYAKVESTIKNYLDSYAVLLQATLKDMHDDNFTKILSYDNYQKDGKEFKKSFTYISNSKKNFNKNVDKLIKLSKEDSIIKYGENNLNGKKLDMYKELMLSREMLDDLKENKKNLDSAKTRINNLYDTSNDILNFLVKNKDNWKLENKEIKFKTESLYNEYTNKIKKLSTDTNTK